MKLMRLLLAALVVSGGFVGGIRSAEAQTQAEMNEEAGESLKEADRDLNIVYKKVLAAHEEDEAFVQNLKAAQRAWLQFVDLHLKSVFPIQAGENPREVYGSMYPLSYAEAKLELVKARSEQLEALLQEE